MADLSSPVVIKVGGALLENPQIAGQLLAEIKTLQSQRPVILVHGGGPLVETLLAAMQLTSTKIDGLRVTPDEQMPFVCGALAGSANKSLCGLAIGVGITPVGLSLLDGGISDCKVLNEKYGAVGVPAAGNPELLNQLLSAGFLPVISSIGSNAEGRLLNVNADQAATVIAELMGGDLLLLSNVDGVLDGDKQLILELDQPRLDEEVAKGVIKDGMLVKVAAAMQAATEDVVATLERVCRRIGYSATIRVDQGSEFISRDMDLWAYQRGITLDFSRPGKPTDNPFIEAFNGRFRGECLNSHWFMSLEDAAEKLEAWHRDYNEERPHSAIGHKVPAYLMKTAHDTSPCT